MTTTTLQQQGWLSYGNWRDEQFHMDLLRVSLSSLVTRQAAPNVQWGGLPEHLGDPECFDQCNPKARFQRGTSEYSEQNGRALM